MFELHRNRANPIQRWAREHIAKPLAEKTLPTEVQDFHSGLKRAEELRKKENRDILFITTHPTMTDEPREYVHVSWASEVLGDDRIIVPNASKQMTFLNRLLGAMTGIRLHSIVTQSVIDEGNRDEKEKGFGNKGYYKDIKRSVGSEKTPKKKPVTIYVAPHARRVTNVNEPMTRAGEFALTAGRRKIPDRKNTFGRVDEDWYKKTAVVFLGVEVNGVSDYQYFKGPNLGARYTIHVGRAMTGEEIISALKTYRIKNHLPEPPARRPFANFDDWAQETQLATLSPKTYR